MKIPLNFHLAVNFFVERVDGDRDLSNFFKASIVLTKGWSNLASTWTRVSKLETLECFRRSKKIQHVVLELTCS
jgi:hypothetical protein